MTKEEILRYIFLCVSYKHNNDISPYITKSTCEKENLLFENAIEFLDKLSKEIVEFQKENDKLKGEIDYLSEQIQELKIELDTPESVVLDKLDEAKELIQNIIRVTWNEGWNYSLDWKVKAEDFLKEVE